MTTCEMLTTCLIPGTHSLLCNFSPPGCENNKAIIVAGIDCVADWCVHKYAGGYNNETAWVFAEVNKFAVARGPSQKSIFKYSVSQVGKVCRVCWILLVRRYVHRRIVLHHANILLFAPTQEQIYSCANTPIARSNIFLR